MNYFNTGTLMYILFLSLLVSFLSFILRKFKEESKNSLYFLISSIWVSITIMFLFVLVLILPKTDKVISSEKCFDFEMANRDAVVIQEGQDEKICQIKIIEDRESNIPYLEVRTTSVVLEILPVFEVEQKTENILHMPMPSKAKSQQAAFN